MPPKLSKGRQILTVENERFVLEVLEQELEDCDAEVEVRDSAIAQSWSGIPSLILGGTPCL